jgi:hypothetical protein
VFLPVSVDTRGGCRELVLAANWPTGLNGKSANDQRLLRVVAAASDGLCPATHYDGCVFTPSGALGRTTRAPAQVHRGSASDGTARGRGNVSSDAGRRARSERATGLEPATSAWEAERNQRIRWLTSWLCTPDVLIAAISAKILAPWTWGEPSRTPSAERRFIRAPSVRPLLHESEQRLGESRPSRRWPASTMLVIRAPQRIMSTFDRGGLPVTSMIVAPTRPSFRLGARNTRRRLTRSALGITSPLPQVGRVRGARVARADRGECSSR